MRTRQIGANTHLAQQMSDDPITRFEHQNAGTLSEEARTYLAALAADPKIRATLSVMSRSEQDRVLERNVARVVTANPDYVLSIVPSFCRWKEKRKLRSRSAKGCYLRVWAIF